MATSIANQVPHDHIGTQLVREWLPEGEAKAVIVLVHGIAEHSGRYERTGALLADAGFWVRSYDHIGHGGSGGDRVDIDDWERFHHQLEEHMDWAFDRGVPVILFGHSLGSVVSMGYVVSDRRSPDLLVLTAPTLEAGAKWQHVLAAILSKVAPTVSMPQNVKGAHLSRDPEVGEAYFNDPLVNTSGTPRFGKAFFDEMAFLRGNIDKIDVPTLALHGGRDKLVLPPSSIPLGELPNCERRLYPPLHHEILNEPEGPDVVADIVEWIEANLP